LRNQRHIELAPCWSKLLFEAQNQIPKSIGETRSCIIIPKVFGGRKAQLRLARNSKSDRSLRQIEAAPASIGDLLKSVFELQAAAGDDYARIGDLRAVCGDRALRIGAAGISLRRKRRGSHGGAEEQDHRNSRHGTDSKACSEVLKKESDRLQSGFLRTESPLRLQSQQPLECQGHDEN
jgi:hypothetical protein